MLLAIFVEGLSIFNLSLTLLLVLSSKLLNFITLLVFQNLANGPRYMRESITRYIRSKSRHLERMRDKLGQVRPTAIQVPLVTFVISYVCPCVCVCVCVCVSVYVCHEISQTRCGRTFCRRAFVLGLFESLIPLVRGVINSVFSVSHCLDLFRLLSTTMSSPKKITFFNYVLRYRIGQLLGKRKCPFRNYTKFSSPT